MHDYLLKFENNAAANAVMKRTTEDGVELVWVDSVRVSVWLADPSYPGYPDPDTGEMVSVGERRSTAVWWCIGSQAVDESIYDLPNCVIEAARPETPTPWAECVVRHKLPQAEMDSFLRFSPIWAGSQYEFA